MLTNQLSTSRVVLTAVALMLHLGTVGCSDEADGGPSSSAAGAGGATSQGGSGGIGGGGGSGGGGDGIQWSTCSLYPGADDGLAECALVQFPLRWAVDDGQIFTTAVKRLLSSSTQVRTQLWLLHGGPGGSGTIDLPGYMEWIQQSDPELDVYTLDARGTGNSEWLGCPDQEATGSDGGSWVTLAELDDCIAYVQAHYGDRLDVYGTTQAAQDLGALVDLTREPDKQVVIWGGSGGTFWAQRYLHFYPSQADGIIIEGIVPPDSSLVFQDEYDDTIARQILQMCAADGYCSSKLPDPEATLAELFTKLDNGHCATLGLDTSGAKSFIRSMDYYHPVRQFTPGFIYRLDRCDQADINAIYNFYQVMWASEEPEHSFSTVLFFNEGWSELWEHKDFADNGELLAYLDDVHAAGLVTMGMGYDRNEYFLAWPRYTDPLDDQWASSDVPMLMLQGVIDPSTPEFFAQTVAQHFNGPHQRYFAFAHATHNVTNGTPLEAGSSPSHCGQQLYLQFAADPTAALDSSCVTQALPLDFEGAAWAPYLLGEADFFENGGSSARGSATSPPTLRHTVTELGRRLQRQVPGLAERIVERARVGRGAERQ